MKGKGLDLNDDIQHEQLKWKIERISWIILLVIAAAALAGFLGAGLFTEKNIRNKAFNMRYSFIERYSTPSEIEITTRYNPSEQFAIWINDEFIKGLDQISIQPQPKSNYIENNNAVYVFDEKKNNKAPVKVLFQFGHTSSGIKKLRAGINKDFIETTQIVLP